MIASFDVLLVIMALAVMAGGFIGHVRRWKQGKPVKLQGTRKRRVLGLLAYILGHRKIMEDRRFGIPHLFIFWGFIVPIIIIILAQFSFTMPPKIAEILSLILDICGGCALIGTVMIIFCRISARNKVSGDKSVSHLWLLLAVLITGFVSEGIRLAVIPEPNLIGSPVGFIVSQIMPASPLLLDLMIRLHFFLVLVFLALFPFSIMRHILAAPLSIYCREEGLPGELRTIELEREPFGSARVEDLTWKQLLSADACLSCGRCERNCPAFLAGKPLSPQKVIRTIFDQMDKRYRFRHSGKNRETDLLLIDRESISEAEIWSCTMCMACVQACPVMVQHVHMITDMRRYLILSKGFFPVESKPMLRNLEIFGDVYGKGPSCRTEWSTDSNLNDIENYQKGDVLFWVGCSGAFHHRVKEISRAFIKIMSAAGVNTCTMGKQELCCGDPARRMGQEELFQNLAQQNIRKFKDYGIEKIVTFCPHCFNIFKNEYPHLGGEFEVVHSTTFLDELIREGKIVMKYPLSLTASYHDPCYLGRGNGIYDSPRAVLQSVPELRFKELSRSKESAFCCGGGGGRMWMHDASGSRINEVRSTEISHEGVDLVSSACPYCIIMLEDGIQGLEVEKKPPVLDITEVVARSLA